MGGRPAKAIKTASGARTKQVKAAREEAESRLRGGKTGKNGNKTVGVTCPAYLTSAQKYIFDKVKTLLKDAGVLGSVDGYMIAVCAVSIDRVREIDKQMNGDGKICDKDAVLARSKYLSDFYRSCNELGLSPQARAKLGVLAASKKAEETDPLVKVLDDYDDD